MKAANNHLVDLKTLIARDNSLNFRVRGLILEGMIRCYQTELDLAQMILDSAYTLAQENKMEDLQNEANQHLSHIKIQETALNLHSSVEEVLDSKPPSFPVEDVLQYLDSLIKNQKKHYFTPNRKHSNI